jgi:hypothetical protein
MPRKTKTSTKTEKAQKKALRVKDLTKLSADKENQVRGGGAANTQWNKSPNRFVPSSK